MLGQQARRLGKRKAIQDAVEAWMERLVSGSRTSVSGSSGTLVQPVLSAACCSVEALPPAKKCHVRNTVSHAPAAEVSSDLAARLLARQYHAAVRAGRQQGQAVARNTGKDVESSALVDSVRRRFCSEPPRKGELVLACLWWSRLH